ncbi:glycine cleavage system protein GcvH [Fervidicoccus fontis]|jgi:glycine cleavage system H protein|uniref:Probable glycine cleavage system H protein n=2 Tax=Fervidicoccus fontis TaxID=683846 RepID=I0A076_FERFK|nr:glycine cleavage system protein GcvH [Fervidicoccus fontis]AFH42383.1 glycine cleavage system protein H [Fervidicoccus fontis Kam940]MBE9391690.1 glycine cleavage system protein GcvH [Fervidicoccus fontis]PMB76119.1 MAG: glycine cleavage system protein H [Fervidicoccus fontis]PMB77646.1 MAG: glycine cleavage system protein H [Fervidicoccus fontis]HEW64408.1 glycine cleavage system protein GcvH [Fervidicoccus fontis]
MTEIVKIKDYNVRKDFYYTETDEWIKLEGMNARIGITDYAQKHLKDIIGIDLPEKGKKIKKGEVLATLDSIKATSEVYAPISGEILDVNETLLESPELMNSDPYESGWIALIKIENNDELNSLLTFEQYVKLLESRK